MRRRVRLPAHIKPSRYKLLIKPDLENFVFEGEVAVSLAVEKPADSIVLHAKELEVYDAAIKISNSQFPIVKQVLNPKDETIKFIFKKRLPKGKGELSLKFKGILNDKMRGFYRSHYYRQGIKKHLATTQFEATDARRAFPCFDEPAQKAIFDVTVMVPPGLTAISNTIASKIKEHESGYKTVSFEPTPKMSTYLLAVIVGDFEFIEKRTGDGVLVRVFVTPGKKHQARFALDAAVKILEFYNRYFGIPYPLPVLDLIAIPDFSHGAMENWGAVTYRESALLVDPEHSSASNRQWVALVIAHELAHQWFGNLVTMDWWTDLWLNEGFASYLEYLAVDRLFPGWDIWTQFANNDLGPAFKLDALKNTHPIEIEVRHPDEIGEIFDEVSYSKGASVIRMLAGYLGEKKFREGLKHYLKRHSFANAKTKDLWAAFEKISKKPVKKLMATWTHRPGYPLVRVIDRPKSYGLVQSRFFSSPISKKQLKDRTVWQIPLKTLGPKIKNQKLLMGAKAIEIKKTPGAWLKLNAGESSLVRIDYPAQMLEKLSQAIKAGQLPALDRLGIVRDAFALAESGDLPSVQALGLCESYANEDDYTVWTELIAGLNSIDTLLFRQKSYELFRGFAREILKPIVKKVGWKAKKGEAHTFSLLRSLALYASGSFGEKAVIDRAKNLFGKWMRKNLSVSPDLRGVVYSLAAQNGGQREHRFLIGKYNAEFLQEEKNRIGRGLGQFKDNRLVSKTLAFAISKNVRPQDTAGIFASVWLNNGGRQAAWDFTKRHWDTLLKRYPASGHMLSRFVKPASLFLEIKLAEELRVFFKERKAPGINRTIEQVLEKIYSNSAWRKRDLAKIEIFLTNKKQSS